MTRFSLFVLLLVAVLLAGCNNNHMQKPAQQVELQASVGIPLPNGCLDKKPVAESEEQSIHTSFYSCDGTHLHGVLTYQTHPEGGSAEYVLVETPKEAHEYQQRVLNETITDFKEKWCESTKQNEAIVLSYDDKNEPVLSFCKQTMKLENEFLARQSKQAREFETEFRKALAKKR